MLSKYIPQHFIDNYHDIVKNNYIVIKGYVIYAEIHGMQSMCDKLSDKGEQGSKAVSSAMMQIFEPLLKIIHKRGGSVYKLSADSIAGFFPGTIPSRSVNNCGIELMDLMKDMKSIKNQFGRFTIGFKAGAAYGETIIGQLGKSEKDYFIAGSAFEKAAECSHSADKGEFLVNCSMRFRLGICDFKTKEGYYYVSEKIEELFEPSPHISRPGKINKIELFTRKVISDIDREKGTGYGEFTDFTVLCAGLSAKDHTSGFDHAGLSELLTCIFRISSDYGGLPLRTDLKSGDNKVIILFGVIEPSTNSEENAAKCALDIIKESGNNKGLRMAINSGAGYLGISGSPERHEFICAGDVLGTCIKLMRSADSNEIIASGVSSSKMNGAVFENFRDKGFKGIKTRYKIASLKGFLKKESPVHEMITGRDKELSEYRDAVSKGTVRKVFITGDKESGKSTLSKAFSEISSKTGKIFSVLCEKETQNTPYITVIDLINSFLKSFSSDRSYALKKLLADIKESHNYDLYSRFLGITEYNGRFIDRALNGVIDDVSVSLFMNYSGIYRTFIFIDNADYLDKCSLSVLRRCLEYENMEAVFHFNYENEVLTSSLKDGKNELDFKVKLPEIHTLHKLKKDQHESVSNKNNSKKNIKSMVLRYYDIFCYEPAVILLRDYVKSDPSKDDAAWSLLLEAEIYRAGKEYGKGIDLCDKVMEMMPGSGNEYYSKATVLKVRMLFESARYNEAVTEAELLDGSAGTDLFAIAKCLLGLSQLKKGMFPSAEITVQEMYNIKNEIKDPEASSMFFELSGSFEFHKEKYKIARAYFEDMLAVSQADRFSGQALSALISISLCYEKEGENKKAIEILDKLCDESLKIHNFDHAIESIESCFRNTKGSERKAVFYSDRWFNAANRLKRLSVSESIKTLMAGVVNLKTGRDRNEYR